MVEPDLPKVVTRVRFPSLAPSSIEHLRKEMFSFMLKQLYKMFQNWTYYFPLERTIMKVEGGHLQKN